MEETKVNLPVETEEPNENQPLDDVTETISSESTDDRELNVNTNQDDSSNEISNDFSLDIKFNKEHLKLNREEAVKYAQMGKKLESLDTALSQLQQIAAADNKTLKQFANDAFSDFRESKYEHYREIANGNEEILEALIAKDSALDESILQAEVLTHLKLQQDEVLTVSSEFNELKNNVSEFENQSFDSVPDEVLIIRHENGISLFDAYLRWQYQNSLSAKNEIENQQSNAENSSGSAFSSEDNFKPSWESGLLKGIWGNK